jgi:hypothetical protein
MNYISVNGESINLNIDKYYIVMDLLYFKDINKEMGNLDLSNLYEEARSKVFQYAYAPFARIFNKMPEFSIKSIKESRDVIKENRYNPLFFTTDTGVLIFVAEEHFIDFVSICNYDEIIDAVIPPYKKDFWNTITSRYPAGDIALVTAPEISLGFDLRAGGGYKIVLE